MEKHMATKKTELIRAPTTSALAQPYVFLLQFLGLILKLMKAIIRAITSLIMWNASATKAMEFVKWPTISSTNIKEVVIPSIISRRGPDPHPTSPPQISLLIFAI